MKFFVVALVALLAVIGQTHAGHWAYGTEEEEWGDICEKGEHQSPIDIKKNDVKSVKYDTFHYSADYRKGVDKCFITNNGHTVQLSATKDATSRMVFIPGNSATAYTFGQVHCHWSSEHLLEGKPFAVECHFVHYNSSYASVTDAVNSKTPKPLTIIGVFFQEAKKDSIFTSLFKTVFGVKDEKKENIAMKAFTDNLDKVTVPVTDPIQVNSSFNPYDMIHPNKLSELDLVAYNYNGSLTTPGCNEDMNWFVVREPQPLSSSQLAAFEKVLSSPDEKKPMTGNNREVKKLNGRSITEVHILSEVAK